MNHDPAICRQYFYCSQRRQRIRVCDNRQRDAERDDERGEDDDEDENNPLGRWPHALSPALACLGCTLGLFNISRFAILSIQFGANFIVQFLILSLVIGIPLLTLQVCLGQRLAAGSVDMWKISPLFQGVGIALLAAQAFIGIYSIVGVSWMFVYFRDSFITKQDRYRWAEPFALYREDIRPTNSPGAAGSGPNGNNNSSYKLSETVPDYFNGAVLQRHHLNEPDPGVVTLKFQVAFNLAVVWMIVFVSLSKGLRSYGKVVYVFTLVPIFGTLVLCTKLLGLTPPGSLHQLFPGTVWAEFFINGRSWVAASSEVFLTWGLLGAAAMQIAAHNKHKHLLQRDTSLVVVLTFVVLLLSAFLANTCVQILKYHGYIYTTSSFERISSYTFLRPINQPSPSGYSSTPERFMAHASFLVGQRVSRPGAELTYESGYQVLRLSTELVPATLAVLGTEQVSPFWAVLFYFILILFGIAQQLAIWHCVITGIMAINTKMMKLWETTITFFSCACAYILGLPMATEGVAKMNSYPHKSPPHTPDYYKLPATPTHNHNNNNHQHHQQSSVTSCYFCNDSMDSKYLSEHLVHCGAVLEECPEKCGAYVPRAELQDHLNQCFRGLSNKVHRTGASIDEQIRSLHESAWKNKVVSILSLLRSAVSEGEQEIKELRDTLASSLQITNEALRKDILDELFESRRRLANLEKTCGELRLEEREKSCVVIEELRAGFSAESSALRKLWQEQAQNVHDMRLELEMRCKLSKELVGRYDVLIEKTEALERRLQSQADSIAEQATGYKTLRFQMKENVAYVEELIRDLLSKCNSAPRYYQCDCQRENLPVGRLVWRIDGFQEKMDEAKRSDAVLYSPAFHDKEYGYTVRMELYLNGLGQWRNRHVIGCLRVIDGKWDPLLDWPCVLRADVTLRDQENSVNDVDKFVKTVKKGKSNEELEHNADLYMFIPHTTLARHKGYTCDDVMFLEIRVRDQKFNGSTMSLFGIYVVYYLDYTVGGAWWILVLYLVQVAAVFAVRGRPHTGDAVVAELFPPTGRCLRYWAGPLLSFTWNVVLPITLMVLSITIFKSTGYRELYTYRRMNKDYWSIWARQLGASIQLIPILMIPVVAVIQTCRYLNNGPPDIFDRIQLLYRPSLEPDDQRNGQSQLNGAAGGNLHGNGLVSSTTELPFEDPPPKYTPPPSYTTATGARIAKMLRQSFRRSVRRIANVLGEGGSAAAARNRPALQQQPPPPDYAAVLVEMNQSVSSRDIAIHIAEQIRPNVADSRRPTSNHSDRLHPHPHNQYRSNTIDRSSCRDIISTIERPPMNHRGHYTVDRNAGRRPYNNSNNNASSNLTATEVANLLRSSIRRNAVRRSFHQQQQQQQPQNAVSVENLVEAAAPIARQDSLVKPPEQRRPTASSDKTADEMESSVSVI
ncbi:hypothetical protein TSAR_017027 [Trichomalopsis sarcophagae]|uniref:MATH domain-containing protein n=1 Tax=Trichomalopsis sarcophagae TaxID=543379 RepID=A0A232FH03_9HYME|nr:hypothetical protein TSAR_017027 [Trichomalopsis sarcophagae]